VGTSCQKSVRTRGGLPKQEFPELFGPRLPSLKPFEGNSAVTTHGKHREACEGARMIHELLRVGGGRDGDGKGGVEAIRTGYRKSVGTTKKSPPAGWWVEGGGGGGRGLGGGGGGM